MRVSFEKKIEKEQYQVLFLLLNDGGIHQWLRQNCSIADDGPTLLDKTALEKLIAALDGDIKKEIEKLLNEEEIYYFSS